MTWGNDDRQGTSRQQLRAVDGSNPGVPTDWPEPREAPGIVARKRGDSQVSAGHKRTEEEARLVSIAVEGGYIPGVKTGSDWGRLGDALVFRWMAAHGLWDKKTQAGYEIMLVKRKLEVDDRHRADTQETLAGLERALDRTQGDKDDAEFLEHFALLEALEPKGSRLVGEKARILQRFETHAAGLKGSP